MAKFEPGTAVPPDLLFASASGLDPEISPEGAQIQIVRVMKARGWPENRRPAIETLIQKHTAPRQLGFLGEKRVNVLALNTALDELG